MRPVFMVVFAVSAVGCQTVDAGSPDDIAVDTVRMSVAWEVAPGIHPAADSLGYLSGIAVDDRDNVYASDRLAAKIWMFDDQGRFRGGIGRKGEGPGEFTAPTGPSVGPDGRLYIRDVFRVSVFGPDPTSGLLTTLESTFDGPVYADWMSMRRTRFDPAGALLYPGKRWLEDGTSQRFLLRFNRSGVLEDTIFVPAQQNAAQLTAFVRLGPGGGQMLQGLNHVPFAPLPVWSVTETGTIVSGDAQAYDLVETDAQGAVVATIHRDIALEGIPKEERRDSIAALRERLDSIGVPLDRVEGMPQEVRSLDVPEVYPAYMGVYVGDDGNVWVRRWSVGGGDRSLFDVFAPEGEYQHTVVLSRFIQVEPTPFLSADGVVGITTSPFTGEHIILRFSPDSMN